MNEFFTHTIAFVGGVMFTLFVIWLIAKLDGREATQEDSDEFENKMRKFNEYKETGSS